MKNQFFDAVVLAGNRASDDPVASAAGVAAKVLAPVGGKPMVLRVLDVLRQCREIRRIVLVGPDAAAMADYAALQQLIDAGDIAWLPPEAGPSRSAGAGLQYLHEQHAREQAAHEPAQQQAPPPVLLTTGDHALLTLAVVEDFLARATAVHTQTQADAVVGLVEKQAVQAAFPEGRRTGLKFREATYCGCNLFALMTPTGGRVVNFWQRIEHLRKQPLKLLGAIGWWQALRFRLGRLRLDQALAHLGMKIDARLAAVHLPHALAAVDVDSARDWRHVVRWLQQHPDAVDNGTGGPQHGARPAKSLPAKPL